MRRASDKRLADATLEAWRAGVSASGQRLVFTNGCFDLLHLGHTRYLEAARELGDCLLVAVNSDASVRQLKGPPRPLMPLEDRLGVLGALECVDAVIAFEEDTPLRLIERTRPDVLVKGGDWALQDIVGGPVVQSYGGRVDTIPLVKGRSTTALMHHIRGHA